MPNGKLRYLIGIAVPITLAVLIALWDWSTSRASDDEVDVVLAATQANATRLEKHEREANAISTKVLVNQAILATSIDFLVSKQDPRRKPIAPTIEAPTLVPEAND